MMEESILQVKNLYKLFVPIESRASVDLATTLLKEGASREEVLKETGITAGLVDINFEVKKGEIFVLIGLSGSGKSTLVRCLNLLHEPTSGEVIYKGKNILAFSEKELLEYRRTKISMVFQNFGLMDNRNVLENTYYGLEVRGVSKTAREQKAREMLAMVGLESWAEKSIADLSGGMKQRVGIARALANDPDILLMDEAFSALDPLVKNDLQFELMRIQEKMGKTIIFITHDINEAFKIGTRVGILRDGKMVQVATPEEMLTNPADGYVSDFINHVDNAKVLSVSSIMSTPTCLMRTTDGPKLAIKSMQINGVSSAYIVGEHMEYVGMLTLDSALRLVRVGGDMQEYIIANIPVIEDMNAPVADVLPLAASTPFPLPVVDENKAFVGIVTRAAVLASLT